MIPVLETGRLRIRPFTMQDLPDVHQLLDIDLADANLGSEVLGTLEARAQWLQWSVLNYAQLAGLHQPPYGDRAIVLSSTGRMVGACGFVPCLNVFERLPSFAGGRPYEKPGLSSTEFGLFYAISPRDWRQGYATEAARALMAYAFDTLHLERIVATTDHTNTGSIGVMRKLGMQIERNPDPDPPWLQVVGWAENPARTNS